MNDVLILGAGLAGMTLALQLRRARPELTIALVERNTFPVPEAAHKVGESSVEIGAHYFADVLGLREHLERDQLPKFGFRFFFNDRRTDLPATTELGASRPLPTGSFQIDRGRFENHLADVLREQGIVIHDGSAVQAVELAEPSDGDGVHRVTTRDGTEHTGRWLIDASGRHGLLKRQLGLAQPNPHAVGAAWFRVPFRLDVDTLSDDPAWRTRCDPPNRWLSTIHLCGEGYWVWLIALASGSHSVGIVADPRLHPFESYNTLERALAWLAEHQPQLHAMLRAGGGIPAVQDFKALRRFAMNCKQVFDGNRRWAITGEAGMFLDPFYSPGSDYIAIANTMITDLVTKDAEQLPVGQFARLHERCLRSLFDAHWPLYLGQYGLFGHNVVMPAKVFWDYTYYWGIPCLLFFQNRLTDVRAMAKLQARLGEVAALNESVQKMFLEWAEKEPRVDSATMIDQASVPWFVELNRGLTDRLDEEGFEKRLEGNIERLRWLAEELRGQTLGPR